LHQAFGASIAISAMRRFADVALYKRLANHSRKRHQIKFENRERIP
jgi:hypothetical protein